LHKIPRHCKIPESGLKKHSGVVDMLSNADAIKKAALRLEPRERALLAAHLIDSLDTDADPNDGRLWTKEAERRYKEYKEGRVKAKSADIVLRKSRARFK
jgi:putative addiction module component (TIGR02574 family)